MSHKTSVLESNLILKSHDSFLFTKVLPSFATDVFKSVFTDILTVLLSYFSNYSKLLTDFFCKCHVVNLLGGCKYQIDMLMLDISILYIMYNEVN